MSFEGRTKLQDLGQSTKQKLLGKGNKSYKIHNNFYWHLTPLFYSFKGNNCFEYFSSNSIVVVLFKSLH